jgi:Protein of unknown function (DUF3703)
MNPTQKSAYQAEITEAKRLLALGKIASGFAHLERAHVLGQAYVLPHMHTHWLMLKVEIRRRRPMAAFGQVIRFVFGGIGSALGHIPVGNTGGSDISMFKSMPIAPELKAIIEDRAPP